MKNIHLIETDKSSRLVEFGGQYFIQEKHQENFISYNMYISSDEQIKEGDYGLDTFHKEVRKFRNENFKTKYDKKIILTTDPYLIKDKVQAIDDEFLEWFVKNPGCEDVKVESERVFKLDKFNQREFYTKHKIIIPKEESKQETLEEAALKYASEKLRRVIIPYNEFNANVAEYVGFVNGAKWQQEQNKNKFSEENMQEYAEFCIKCYVKGLPCIIAKDWFEQYKKK